MYCYLTFATFYPMEKAHSKSLGLLMFIWEVIAEFVRWRSLWVTKNETSSAYITCVPQTTEY